MSGLVNLWSSGLKTILANNPAKGIGLPKRIKSTPYHVRNIDTQKTLTMEQINILLENSKNTPIHMQVLFNVLMGLRRSEIIGLKYSDVDFVNRTLRVERQLSKIINTNKEDFAPKTWDISAVHHMEDLEAKTTIGSIIRGC
jgi:integrase